mmetsp:Transcript_38414/g.80496  ORF Transcript_38414/g.80496 Transcript_38414/m.80496 type:complete len:518 (-) Transcript_38414:702-2255(-)
MATSLENAISETKDVLQPLFAKPKLSTKLLSKPPFRFIHDIIVATIKSTGFPNGLFGLEELQSSKFKDSKAAKVSFLDKLIHIVNVGNGTTLSVSSSKIVAGLEPQKTNILLSTFGLLAQDEMINRNKLIQHCLDGKGIDEFRAIDKSSLAGEKNATSEDTHPVSSSSSRENSSIDRQSIVEQMKMCNEDIEQTRVIVSRIVTKPKCSDKLLNKPPFRFIHDLIMAIGKATQFDFCQIFSDDELVSSNVKEKHSKIQFLEKLVNFIEATLESSIHVKPSKIISGLEPERTRYLLQMFTLIATTKPLANPTEGVDMTRQEPTESEVGCDEPLNEGSKETVNDLVCGNEKENVSPNNDSHAKSFDSDTLPPEDAAQGNPPEEAPVGIPSEMTTEAATAIERPTTSRGGVPSVIKDAKTKENPCSILRPTTAIIENKDDSESESVHSETQNSWKEKKDEGVSIFQKIVQEQRLNKSRERDEYVYFNCLFRKHSHCSRPTFVLPYLFETWTKRGDENKCWH